MTRKKRSWHDIGAPLEGPSVDTVQKSEISQMKEWSVKIEAAVANTQCKLPVSVLDIPPEALLQHWLKKWLWLTDPTDECTAEVGFNRMYLYAILFCRGITVVHSSVACETHTIADLLPDYPTVHIHAKNALSGLNIRCLKQTIENLHTQWVCAALWEAVEIVPLLDRLAHRAGVLLSTQIEEKEVGDDDSCEKIPGSLTMSRLTKSSVRTLLNNIMILYRSVHVHTCARRPNTSRIENTPNIIKHHIYAGVDDFHRLSMHWDLPPAAVLNYIHQFAGMYNNVSQVAYYCYPEYQKRTADANMVEQIAAGTKGHLYTLPSLMQLYPDVPVVHADGQLDIFTPCATMRWLMMDKTMFLITRDNTMYTHSDIMMLAAMLE